MSSTFDPVFGCDLVTSKLDKDGYAYHGTSRAHIVAWVAVHGPVPEGLVIDHLCRRRNCRAVHHLEAVKQSENLKRIAWRHRRRIVTCQRGHDMGTNRVITPEGGIVCRQCNRDASQLNR
jgi:hypothetical protein